MSGEWRHVGHRDDFEDGRLAFRTDHHNIGLFLYQDQIFAIDNLCTHGNAELTDGEMDDCFIECPLHAGLVDVRTGRAAGAPINRDTRTYRVRLDDDGGIMIALP